MTRDFFNINANAPSHFKARRQLLLFYVSPSCSFRDRSALFADEEP